MPPVYPLINGRRYDFSAIELIIGTDRIIGFKEISYSDELAPGEVYGSSAQLIGRTRGQRKSSASLTMYLQEFDELVQKLGNGFMEKVFDVVVQYADHEQPTLMDQILGCRITKVDKGGASGTDALEARLELHVMRILHHGNDAVVEPFGV
jgi:hypothetical protein